MPITFVRIDDRMLHGQIVTRWSRTYPCKGILLVDEAVSKDEFQKKIFKNAAPAGTKVGVFNVQDGALKINKAQEVENGYFLIVKSPTTLVKLLDAGGNFGKSINVGPMSVRDNTKTVARNCALTSEEIEAFCELDKRGINIVFQLIPNQTPVSWKEVKNKIK